MEGSVHTYETSQFNFRYPNLLQGAKGDYDFRISDLVKNRDGTDT